MTVKSNEDLNHDESSLTFENRHHAQINNTRSSSTHHICYCTILWKTYLFNYFQNYGVPYKLTREHS